MKYPEFQELHTARLQLRKIRMTDLQNYYTRLGSSEAVTRYMLFQPHKSVEESSASIEKWLARYEAGKCYHWAIALRETDELIGVIDLLRIDEEAESASFAYMLGEKFWNQGFGSEAIRAVFDFGFREMGLAFIEADHMEENGASGAVMRKCGMIYEGTTRSSDKNNQGICDAAHYAILRRDRT